MGYDDKRIIEDDGITTWGHGREYKCSLCNQWHLILDLINKNLTCNFLL